MNKNKLIRLLKTFSPEECRKFRKFAASPYFNEGRNLLPVINAVLEFYPHFDKPGFTKELVIQMAYPGKKFSVAAIDKQLSRAAALADKFLMQQGAENDTNHLLAVQAKELSRRNLNDLFEKKIKEAEKSIAESSPYDVHYFEAIRDLEVIKTDNLLANRDSYRSGEKFFTRGDYNLLDMITKFILSIEDIVLVSYELNMDSGQSLAVKSFGHIDLAGIVQMLKDSGSSYSGLLELRQLELTALMKPGRESYINYRDAVVNNLEKMQWSAKFNTFIIMSSVCIISRNYDKNFFNDELYRLNRLKVDENSYAFREELHTYLPLYVSLLSSFIGKHDAEYIDKLIDKFGSRIDPKHKESFISYTQMCRSFMEKKFDRALEFHSGVNYDHNLIRINAKLMLIQIYYELEFTEELLSLVDSTIKYFKALKNYSKFKRDSILRFLKLVKKLARLRAAGTVPAPETETELNAQHDIHFKGWLREKFESLYGRMPAAAGNIT